MKKIILFSLCLVCFFSCSKPDSVIKDKPSKSRITAAQSEALHLSGTFLNGAKFNSDDFAGQKIVFGFFSFQHRDALPMIRALAQLKQYEREYNFKIILVSIDFDKKADVQTFVDENKINLPVVLEGPGLEIAMQLKVENEVAVYGLGAKHDIEFAVKQYGYAQIPDGENMFVQDLMEGLRIKSYTSTEPRLGFYPVAPDFTARTLDGKTIKLSDYRGKGVLLIFFSPKCPHCHDEMNFLNKSIYPQYKAKGLEVLAVSSLKLEGEVLTSYQALKYSWPVTDDPLRKIHNLYSQNKGVPETYFIDKQGKIRRVQKGFAAAHSDLFTFQIKQLLGERVLPVLSNKKYSGTDVCATCHEPEYVSWSVTKHAQAWEALEVQGDNTNPKCVACHSVGFNDPKGYVLASKDVETVVVPPYLGDVQCESCHGLGGSHVAPSQDVTKDPVALNKNCLTCHTSEFSLHFDFDERVKKVNHSDAAQMMKMSLEERLGLLKKVAKKPSDLFDTKKEYVGVEKCATCHADIAKKWAGSQHAQAFASLKAKGSENDPACLQCHTLGYGEATGYTAHVGDKNFETVGCESCHGPGSTHSQTSKKMDIQALGDECDFCVKGQICASCHDQKNSPDFNLTKGLEKVKGFH